MKILLLALDTLRADHLSGYGYYRPTSPVMDGLMARGTGFLNCSSAFSVTLPTFTSIISGKYCANHKMVVNPYMTPNQREVCLDDATPTLAEVLWDNGYATAAFDNYSTSETIQVGSCAVTSTTSMSPGLQSRAITGFWQKTSMVGCCPGSRAMPMRISS